jgi:hypothetical protein
MINNNMKFDKLVQIVTEAGFRPSAPKNMGGARLNRTKESEGPSGYSSSSVGKSDNFELSTPIDRWEYDPSQNTGKSGFATESKLWKSMLTSFRLLFNDPFFDKQVQKITKRFNDSRDSYKNIRGVDENGKVEKYDEENQLEKLERNQTKYRSDLTGMRDDLDKKNKIINRTKLPPSEKDNMEVEISKIEANIETLNTQKGRAKSEKQKGKIEQTVSELATILNKKRDRFDQATMKPVDIEKLKANIYDIEEKMAKWEDKLEKTTEELEDLYDRINQINQTNEAVNEAAISGFLDLIKFTASGLVKEYQEKAGTEIKSLDQLNWDQMPSNLNDAIDRLKALESDDENVNPILGYLARFERDYENKDFDTGRALDKNVNITTMRDFNKLPFMVLSRVYSSLRSSDKNPIALDKLNTTVTDASKGELSTLLTKLSTNTSESKAEWSDPNTKTYIKGLIDQLPIPTFSKEQMKKRVDRPWMIDRGKTPPAFLKMNIEDETKIKNESFDDFFDRVLNEMSFDEDDYKCDLLEILEKCTGPTKKTSSDRKGKKWMKCAKQPDGSYKKIHFGQKGVRVGGGNSKRAKAFRSRHSCSNAKPGSAKKLSCDNWD